MNALYWTLMALFSLGALANLHDLSRPPAARTAPDNSTLCMAVVLKFLLVLWIALVWR